MAETPVVHVEIVEQAAGALELRLWEKNPNEATRRTVLASEIANLLAQAEASYYQLAAAPLREIGERLFRWLDGGERWLTRLFDSHSNQQVIALAIAAPQRLAHLP
jgi:hypothetical protein